MKAVAGLIVALLLVGAAAWLLHSAAGPLDAWRTHQQAGQDSYLWPELEPGGDGDITYAACASYVPANWIVGVEDKWDGALPAWDFDPVPNCDYAQTVLRWENGDDFCPNPDWVACWKRLVNVPHADHRDNLRTQIVFDRPKFDAHSYAWKTALTAHEWGHNMDLADHFEVSQAVAGTLMNSAIEDPPTYQGPTPGDLSSVRCNAYGYCGDFSGDMRADILARESWSPGRLRLYPGNGAGGHGAARVISSGWTPLDWLLGPGDFNADGCPDILARESWSPGRLRLYPGDCAGGHGAAQIVSSGWTPLDWLLP